MRNKILVIVLTAILGAAAAAGAVWTELQSLDITEVKDGLYMITGNGGN